MAKSVAAHIEALNMMGMGVGVHYLTEYREYQCFTYSITKFNSVNPIHFARGTFLKTCLMSLIKQVDPKEEHYPYFH